jgi:hypothetical protein
VSQGRSIAELFVADVIGEADRGAAATGVLPSVVVAQWADETAFGGRTGPAPAWTVGHNPAGISPGGVIARYPSFAAGVDAWIETMNLAYYVGVRTAHGATVQAVMLGRSPWAAGRYDNGGGPGSALLAIMAGANLQQFDPTSPTSKAAPPMLHHPIVAAVPTPTGAGYYLVGSDGGVFAFGDADEAATKSLPELHVVPDPPIVAALGTPSGKGLLLIGADGGVFALGDAHFPGSLPALGVHVTSPIVAAFEPPGGGLGLIGADGGVFELGGARYFGSLPALGVVP